MVISFAGSTGAGKDTGTTVPTQYKAFWLTENGTHHLTADPPYSGLSSADVVVFVTNPTETYRVPNGVKFGHSDFTENDINLLDFSDVTDGYELFGQSKIKELPRTLNFKKLTSTDYIFYYVTFTGKEIDLQNGIEELQHAFDHIECPKKFTIAGTQSIKKMNGSFYDTKGTRLYFPDGTPNADTIKSIFQYTDFREIRGLEFSKDTGTTITVNETFQDLGNIQSLIIQGSLNCTTFDLSKLKLTNDSLVSILTAASKSISGAEKAKTIKLHSDNYIYGDNAEDLIAQCTAKGWTITNLNVITEPVQVKWLYGEQLNAFDENNQNIYINKTGVVTDFPTNAYSVGFGQNGALTCVEKFDVHVKSMATLFYEAYGLWDVCEIDMDGVEIANSMFHTTPYLIDVRLKNTGTIKNMNGMFYNCKAETIKTIDMTSCTQANNMFYSTTLLTDLTMEGSINISLDLKYSPLNSDSVKSVITAASKTTGTAAKTLTFKTGTTVADTDGTFAELVSQCTAKGWTITNLNLTN